MTEEEKKVKEWMGNFEGQAITNKTLITPGARLILTVMFGLGESVLICPRQKMDLSVMVPMPSIFIASHMLGCVD